MEITFDMVLFQIGTLLSSKGLNILHAKGFSKFIKVSLIVLKVSAASFFNYPF